MTPITMSPAVEIDSPVAELQAITKLYKPRSRRASPIHAVDGVDLELRTGETLGLVGESGSGKSTVARLLLRLVEPTSGRVMLGRSDITAIRGARLRAVRSRMQMVFQDPYSSFDPMASVGESISEAIRSNRKSTRSERSRRVAEALDRVRLPRVFVSRHPRELSGGQLQRAAIARALVVNPQLLALDEAVSSLDVSTQAQIVNLLGELQRETEIAYLFISHDLSVVRHVSHDIAVMYLGRIVEIGPADPLYEKPLHPYTQALLSAVPIAHPGRQRRRQRTLLSGELPSASNPPSGCRFRTRCPQAMPVCAELDPPPKRMPSGVTVFCHLYSQDAKPAPPSTSGVRPSQPG